MPDAKREEVERTIAGVLLSEWNPLGVVDSTPPAEFASYAHEIYGLLARGGSDIQVGRLLHQIEREQMHHPDADSRDVTAVCRTLRAIERTM